MPAPGPASTAALAEQAAHGAQGGRVRAVALYPRPVDSARPTRASKGVTLASFVLGGIGGFVAIAFIDSLTDDLAWPTVAGLVAMVAVVFWLQILVHEAGHAIAGMLTGRRLMAAGVGPLRLDRGTGGWRLRWGGGVRGVGGYAAMFPDARADERGPAAVFAVGGPAANLLTAALALAVLRVAPPEGEFAALTCGAIVFCGALLGVLNLLPFKSHGWNTDGYNLRELLRDSPASRVIRAQQCVLALSMVGVRPRDWPAAQLEVPEDLPPDVRMTANMLRLSWALDHGDRPAADAAALALADAHPGTPDGLRQGVATMLATYAARTGDADLLAAWRPLCEGGLLDLSPFRLWLDAEAAAMAGEAMQARELLAKARAARPRIPDPASVVVMGEYLGELEGRLDGAAAPAVAKDAVATA
jgi:hypothetical protein